MVAQRTVDKVIKGKRHDFHQGRTLPVDQRRLTARLGHGPPGSKPDRQPPLSLARPSLGFCEQTVALCPERARHEDGAGGIGPRGHQDNAGGLRHILEREHTDAIERLAQARRAREMQYAVQEPVQKPVQTTAKGAKSA
jgi:hypothetical protein